MDNGQPALRQVEFQVLDAGHALQALAHLPLLIAAIHLRHMEGGSDWQFNCLMRHRGHAQGRERIDERNRIRQAVFDCQDTLPKVEAQILDAGDLAQALTDLRDLVLAVHARNVESFRAHCFLPRGRQSELHERRGHGGNVVKPVRHGQSMLLQVEHQRVNLRNLAQALPDLALLARAIHLLNVEDSVGRRPSRAHQRLAGQRFTCGRTARFCTAGIHCLTLHFSR